MTKVEVYKCYICGQYNPEGMTVVVSGDGKRFTSRHSTNQERLQFDICMNCIDQIPGVIHDALRERVDSSSGNSERVSSE